MENRNIINEILPARQGRANEGVRRSEILKSAADLFASSGFRVSMQEVADACGILAGSLYHHFDSKDKIVEELISHYHRDLGDVARASVEQIETDSQKSDFERITSLAALIVDCVVKHRAALLQTFFDTSTHGAEMADSPSRSARSAIIDAMTELLLRANANGYLRKEIDVPLLSEQICESMMNFAVGTFHLLPEARQVPLLKCRILLEGMVSEAPSNAQLDRSDAFLAAEAVIAGWSQADGDERMADLLEAARTVFGKRGFEVATIREVSSVAKVSTGTIYRMVGSKEALLSMVMEPFVAAATTGWDALMNSNSTPVEKLDAMLWIGINLQHRFSREFVIQLAWLREYPPLEWSVQRGFGKRLSHIKKLLSAGERSGHLRLFDGTVRIRTYCLMELIWVPRSIIQSIGTRGALTQARETLLRGAVLRA